MEYLSSQKLGVGINDGNEAVIHAVKNLQSNIENSQNSVPLNMDLGRALNRISSAIVQEVRG